jgi:hypothetical protein
MSQQMGIRSWVCPGYFPKWYRYKIDSVAAANRLRLLLRSFTDLATNGYSLMGMSRVFSNKIVSIHRLGFCDRSPTIVATNGYWLMVMSRVFSNEPYRYNIDSVVAIYRLRLSRTGIAFFCLACMQLAPHSLLYYMEHMVLWFFALWIETKNEN